MKLLVVVLLCAFIAISWASSTIIPRPHIKVIGGPHAHGSRGETPAETSPSKRSQTLQALTPQQVMSAYGVTYSATAGAGKVICIIDAYGASTAESDLSTFTSRFGLPACTTANGCFQKISMTGTTSYPPDDSTSDWGIEVALDLAAAHTMAPGAKKVLIVAQDPSHLFTALQYAVNTLKPNYISMSWGAPDGSFAPSYDSTYFSNSAISYFASTGDDGTASVEYPSTSAHVIAVGGTSLYTNSAGGYNEQGWSGSTGGCAGYTTAIAAQSSKSGYSALGCGGKKAVPDASYLADPNSGLEVYYSGLYNGQTACTPPNCWYNAGGTSLASPLLAARAAAKGIMPNPSSVYTGGYTYRDITAGANQVHSCTAGPDLVTGVGSLVN